MTATKQQEISLTTNTTDGDEKVSQPESSEAINPVTENKEDVNDEEAVNHPVHGLFRLFRRTLCGH